MPYLGGVQLAREMRKIQPSIPIIFLTGYDRDSALKDCDDIESWDILTKPIRLEEMSALIRSLLDK